METKNINNIYIYITLVFLVLPYGNLSAQTPSSPDESPCNTHYEAAIKFVLDTPIVHPFTVSKDETTGKIGKVIFSSGNLQYSPKYQHIVSTSNGQRCETVIDVFRFAPRQIDRITNGSDAYPRNGNVYYDTIIKADVPSVWGGDSFYAEKRKCTNVTNTAVYVPYGVTAQYHGWIDLFPWGSSCQGKFAQDPGTQQFYPYQYNTNNTGNTANPYGIGPSYYADNDTKAPAYWKVGDINRNNIDTNSGPSRYFDWGYANIIKEYRNCIEIVNGKPIHTLDSTAYHIGTWRTLTAEEWNYLLFTRKVEFSTNNWSICCVEDTTLHATGNDKYIRGILLYPDDYNYTLVDAPKIARANIRTENRNGTATGTIPCRNYQGKYDSYSKSYTTTYYYGYDEVKVSATDFQRYEGMGCVFLPETWNTVNNNLGTMAGWFAFDFAVDYWTATSVNATNGYYMAYNLGRVNQAVSTSQTYTSGYGYVQTGSSSGHYEYTHSTCNFSYNKPVGARQWSAKNSGARNNCLGVRLVQDL